MSYPEENAPVEEESSHAQEVKREIIEFVKMVAWFLVLFLLVKTYVVEGYEVQGESMEPTLQDRERILVFKLAHNLAKLPFLSGFTPVDQGDIVVFVSPVEPEKRYVKRVIAKGPAKRAGNTVEAGDHAATLPTGKKVTVEFDKGTVFVNHLRIDEDYLVPEMKHCKQSYGEVTLPPGGYYVLGDHRTVSKDSRDFGAVDDDTVVGKAVLRFWPPNKISLLR